MDSSRDSRLTPLQRELLAAFFAREQRFFLTGGGALAGFYFGHRDTEDLDFFSAPGPDLAEAGHAIEDAARSLNATCEPRSTYTDFRRYLVKRGDETCVVDLVIDRAPMIDAQKRSFGVVRVDSLREIAANKICTLLSRSEIKDLVDLQALLGAGGHTGSNVGSATDAGFAITLEQALADAQKKDGSAEPATLAWLLDELCIAPDARLPGGIDPVALDAFRRELARQFRAIAFARARRE